MSEEEVKKGLLLVFPTAYRDLVQGKGELFFVHPYKDKKEGKDILILKLPKENPLKSNIILIGKGALHVSKVIQIFINSKDKYLILIPRFDDDGHINKIDFHRFKGEKELNKFLHEQHVREYDYIR